MIINFVMYIKMVYDLMSCSSRHRKFGACDLIQEVPLTHIRTSDPNRSAVHLENLGKTPYLPSGKLTWLLKMVISSGFTHEKW